MPRIARLVQRPAQHHPAPPPRELSDDQFTSSGRLRQGLLTPRSVFRRLIFQLLLPADQHAVDAGNVRQTIERRLAARFTAADLSTLRRGQPRWVNAMQWERKKMVMEGLLESTLSAGHGMWRLTRAGMREARSVLG